MTWTDKLALLLSACGLCACALAGARSALRHGIVMMVEMWTAAALLRLTHHAGWQAIAAAGALIAIRQLVAMGLRRHVSV